jgi:hypothetical protein
VAMAEDLVYYLKEREEKHVMSYQHEVNLRCKIMGDRSQARRQMFHRSLCNKSTEN